MTRDEGGGVAKRVEAPEGGDGGQTVVRVTMNSSDAPSAEANLLPLWHHATIFYFCSVLKEQFSCSYRTDGWMFHIILQEGHFLSRRD